MLSKSSLLLLLAVLHFITIIIITKLNFMLDKRETNF